MPLNAFIIRPFGIKKVVLPATQNVTADGKTIQTARVEEINFDEVSNKLLLPALARLRMQPHTTDAVISAGNIREDMFHLLMTADLVVADVTYDNPNVYYELGIRHAFRDRFTFLIRSCVHDYPFDLRTDRYFEYDHGKLDDPKYVTRTVDKLFEAIRATLNSERADSPVFRLLPRMRSEDRSRFIAVPRDFCEEVERARKHKLGGDLRLLANECDGFLWEVEGLRVVGRAQFELNFLGGARNTWEEIARRYPDDIEANMVLSTIYQRANDGTRSEQALARLTRSVLSDVNTVAEVQSLKGRNLKVQWMSLWQTGARVETDDQQRKALRSPVLRKAIEAYSASFRGNLNYAYAGLNALSLQIIELSLARKFPEVWEVINGGPAEAYRALEERQREVARLTGALDYAIECNRRQMEASGQVDFWAEILEAAFYCLTSPSPERVGQAYLEAVHWAPRYAQGSMSRALCLYEALDVTHRDPAIDIQANARCAMGVITREEGPSKPGNILLFVGLRMAPSANSPARKRKPRSGDEEAVELKTHRFLRPDMEARARQEIERAILAEQQDKHANFLFGMAAMSNGSDILFHEVCEKIGLNSRAYLALPKDQYVGEYVATAGAEWVDRFNRIYRRLMNHKPAPEEQSADPELNHTVNVLTDSPDLPRWLQGKAGYSLGRRNTLWMLQHALVQRYVRDCDITLVALWDRKGRAEAGDGIQRLADLAERNGIKVVHIDCTDWFEDAAPPAATPKSLEALDGRVYRREIPLVRPEMVVES